MHETQFHPGNNLLLVAAKSQGVFDLVATKKSSQYSIQSGATVR